MPLIHAICVVQLPSLVQPHSRRDTHGSPLPSSAASSTAGHKPPPSSSSSTSSHATASKHVTTATPRQLPEPKLIFILPQEEAAKIDRNVLPFCFPDTDHLVRVPAYYEHTADEYVFTLTRKNLPKLYGFCRRYRVGAPCVGGRLDISPFASANADDVTSAPSFQCICILSDKPYHKFFSHCLQLLHTCRLAGGPAAKKLAETLLAYSTTAQPGDIIPLRSLLSAAQIPGSLHLPRERLRVPKDVGLELFDVPLAPLLSRIDASALLALYSAMICERRILFVSQSLPTLTSCVHAAAALYQPFVWQHIFIPVLTSPLLPFACAPNPYIIGLTPAQFAVLNDEYEAGEIVLVALDEGYVACLNGGNPLVDLEGPTAGNGHTGFLRYTGPKLSPEKVAARVAASGLGGGAGTGGIGSSALLAALTSASDSPVDLSASSSATSHLNSYHGTDVLLMIDASQASVGRRDAALAAAAAAIAAGKHVDNNNLTIGRSGGGSIGSGAGATSSSSSGGGSGGGGGMMTGSSTSSYPANSAAALEAVLSPFHAFNRSHAYDDDVVLARAHRRAYINRRLRARALARERVMLLYSRILPQHNMEKSNQSALGGGGASVASSSSSSSSLALVDHNEIMEGLTHEHEEAGTISLGVDLVNLTSSSIYEGKGRGNSNNNATAARRRAAGNTNGNTNTNSNTSKRYSAGTSDTLAAASAGGLKTLTAKMVSATMAGIAMATGGSSSSASSSNCPGFRLSYEIRAIYTKEKKEGIWDEGGVYAAILSFFAIVFGRVTDFVYVEGTADQSSMILNTVAMRDTLEPRFAKEEFVRYTTRHPTMSRLMEEVMMSQALYTFACDYYLHTLDLRAAAAAVSANVGAGDDTNDEHSAIMSSPSDFSSPQGRTLPTTPSSTATSLASPTPVSRPLFSSPSSVSLSKLGNNSATSNNNNNTNTRKVFDIVDIAMQEVSSPSSDSNFTIGAQASIGSNNGLNNGRSISSSLPSASSSLGSTSSASLGGGGGTLGGAFSNTLGGGGGGGGGGGPTSLLGNHVSFSNVHKKLSTIMSELYEPMLDSANLPIPSLAVTTAGGGNATTGGSTAGGGGQQQQQYHPSSFTTSGSSSASSTNNNASVSHSSIELQQQQQSSVMSALSGLVFAGSCPAAISASYRIPVLQQHHPASSSSSSSSSSSASTPATNPGITSILTGYLPDVGLPIIVTALRALLTAYTAVGVHLEEPYTPFYVIQAAAAATYDPHLIQVVMGVIWARMNDCTDKHWQQGYKSLSMLYALLRVGSPRIAALCVSFIPLLRFLMHPARVLAVKAGFAAEKLGGQSDSCGYIQGANVVWRARRSMYMTPSSAASSSSSSGGGGVGGSNVSSNISMTSTSTLMSNGSTSLSYGLPISSTPHPLSSIGPREGAQLVARQAARVYLLLASPRRWLVERTVALGPACVSNGVSLLPVPYPYPLVNLETVAAPGSAALPPSWISSPHTPTPTISTSSSSSASAITNALPTTTTTTSANVIVKQRRAAVAKFDEIHKVAAPPIASSRSRALFSLATKLLSPSGSGSSGGTSNSDTGNTDNDHTLAVSASSTHQKIAFIIQRPSYVKEAYMEQKGAAAKAAEEEKNVTAAVLTGIGNALSFPAAYRNTAILTGKYKSMGEACHQPKLFAVVGGGSSTSARTQNKGKNEQGPSSSSTTSSSTATATTTTTTEADSGKRSAASTSNSIGGGLPPLAPSSSIRNKESTSSSSSSSSGSGSSSNVTTTVVPQVIPASTTSDASSPPPTSRHISNSGSSAAAATLPSPAPIKGPLAREIFTVSSVSSSASPPPVPTTSSSSSSSLSQKGSVHTVEGNAPASSPVVVRNSLGLELEDTSPSALASTTIATVIVAPAHDPGERGANDHTTTTTTTTTASFTATSTTVNNSIGHQHQHQNSANAATTLHGSINSTLSSSASVASSSSVYSLASDSVHELPPLSQILPISSSQPTPVATAAAAASALPDPSGGFGGPPRARGASRPTLAEIFGPLQERSPSLRSMSMDFSSAASSSNSIIGGGGGNGNALPSSNASSAVASKNTSAAPSPVLQGNAVAQASSTSASTTATATRSRSSSNVTSSTPTIQKLTTTNATLSGATQTVVPLPPHLPSTETFTLPPSSHANGELAATLSLASTATSLPPIASRSLHGNSVPTSSTTTSGSSRSSSRSNNNSNSTTTAVIPSSSFSVINTATITTTTTPSPVSRSTPSPPPSSTASSHMTPPPSPVSATTAIEAAVDPFGFAAVALGGLSFLSPPPVITPARDRRRFGREEEKEEDASASTMTTTQIGAVASTNNAFDSVLSFDSALDALTGTGSSSSNGTGTTAGGGVGGVDPFDMFDFSAIDTLATATATGTDASAKTAVDPFELFDEEITTSDGKKQSTDDPFGF